MRHRGMWIVAALTFAACKKPSGPWKIRAVGDNGNLSIERPGTSTFATMIDVVWPPEPMPIAHDAAVEVQRLAAAAKKIEIVWETKDAWSGPAHVSLDGVDLAETLIGLGLARPSRRADQPLRDAEARARAARAGGWGDTGRAEILRWLRGRALALDVIGADVDIATWRDTAWQMAAMYEAESLAFFDLSPGDDFGPPACVDRLAAAIAPTLRTPATVDDVTRAFAAGGTLVGALLIGGSPWFTSVAACEAALRSAFPSGCEEP